ncbi:MAG: hypothetical protein HQK50_09640 [Oligoflexia bacterium]|nr:hypothetical protein [Oligoflexia bacterium]MBF0365824.1 hypothetical protein [Oligoflexia bacterium]
MENLDKTIDINSLKIKTYEHIDKSKITEQLEKISKLRLSDFLDAKESDFKSNINEMFSTIKYLDSTLRSMIELNSTLKNEAQEHQRQIKKLESSNKEIKEKLLFHENSTPVLNDLEYKLDLALEDREKFKEFAKQAGEHNQKLQQNIETLEILLERAEEELRDTRREKEIISQELHQAKEALTDIYTHIQKG